MSEDRSDVARLRERFLASIQEATSGEAPNAELIWEAVSGALRPERRREVVDRVATDAAWAEAWRLAREIWRETEAERAPEMPAGPRRTGLWPRNPHLAAAASLLLLVGAGILARDLLAPAPVYRDPGESRIVSLVPEDGLLDRVNLVLEWSPVGEGTRYDVTVTTASLVPIASASDLPEPRFRIPDSDLAGLLSGEKLYWQVTAHLEDGSTNRSRTFVVTIR